MKKLAKRMAAFLMVFTLLFMSMPLENVFAMEAYTEEGVEEENSTENVDNIPTEASSEIQKEISEETEATEETGDTESVELETESAEKEDNTAQQSAGDETATGEENVVDEESIIDVLLKYVVLDQPYIQTPDTQNVVVGLDTSGKVITSAKLIYHCNETGKQFEVNESEIIDNVIRFTVEYQDAEQAGTYTLDTLECMFDDGRKTIALKDIGIDITYGVNTEVTTNPDAVVTDEDDDSDEVKYDVVTMDQDGNVTSQNSIQEAIEDVKEQQDFVEKSYGKSANGNIVVVLDPGHGGSDSGANGNGLSEKNLTLKIAQYCKAELETYQGVDVYMTRTSDTYIGLEDRVAYAKSVGADVFVSIHINSHSTDAPSGAEVYYPNANYLPAASTIGGGIASSILNNLTALGLGNRGTKIKNSENGSTYDDGSLADYYSVIRNSKKSGFTGIIVEHAFVSNASDANNFLNSDEKLQRLGIADATGIASYYGISKKASYVDYPAGTANLTTALNVNGTCEINASNIPDVYGVKYAVWSVSNGADDLVWYTASKDSNGNWKATVPLSNHKTLGAYAVHAYVMKTDGSSYYMGETLFDVEEAVSANISVTNINNVSGTFAVKVSGIHSNYSISSVQIPVWSAANQSDIVWYTAQLQSDGSYIANVDIANHGCKYGTYQVHAYIYDSVGVSSCVGTTSVNVKKCESNVSVSVDSSETNIMVSGWHIPGTLGASLRKVEYAVWSAEDGQDDLVFYTASLNGDRWEMNVPLFNHKTLGKYYIHTYATYANGIREKVAENTINVDAARIDSAVIQNVNTVSGTFDVVVSNPKAIAGVSNVVIPVWSKEDRSDMHWYFATKQADGTYVAHVDIANHNCNFGTYQVYIYIQNGVSGMECVSNPFTVKIPRPKATISNTSDNANANYMVSGWHIPGTLGNSLVKVQYAVWSDKNGQDDLVFYDASLNQDKWIANIPIANHKTTGTYYVHAYATDLTGNMRYVGSTSFFVPEVSVDKVKIQNVNTVSGTFDVVSSGVKASGVISDVRSAIWSASDQSDIRWYSATAQADGTYKAHFDVANHNSRFGRYNVHTYILSQNGTLECVDMQTINMNAPSAQVSASPNGDGSEFLISGWHIPGTLGDSLTGVQYAVWSDTNGQDDLVFYQGALSGDTWYASVPLTNHRTEGMYYVHAYATYKNGAMVNVGTTSFVVTGPSAEKIEIVNQNTSSGTFQVNISGLMSGSDITSVVVPVWSAADQSDLMWYTPTKTSSGNYTVYVDPANHKNNLGNYKVNVYATDKSGINKMVGETSCAVTSVSGYYGIVGSSAIALGQMVAYYNSNAAYPGYYAGSDAPSIENFCQIYLEECNAEGIKAEVAFCQAMKETGFLRFGGDVSITQYNFAGLGATGGVPGNSYSSVREGIRAQVQHLKAYASTEPLNNPCVDNRFSYVARGCAPYVEWLGIQENPYGKGWAAAKNYGYSLKNDYIAKLMLY